jgi:DNA-binding LytR/AlgR family response regulator
VSVLRAVIVDDEPHARADLRRALEALGVTIVGEAEDGARALERIDALRPDVCFLDIHLPGMDGLAIAAREGLPPIVFVTAHAEHGPDAFDLEAVDYVLKPVRVERLRRALERVQRRVSFESETGTRLEVRDARGARYVDARRVEVFSAIDKYVAFTIDGDELLLRTSLDELERRLAPEGFVRAHRAHLVRLGAVRATEDGAQGLVLVLASGALIPVSKRLRAQVKRALSG